MEKAILTNAYNMRTNAMGWMVKILLNPPKRTCQYLPKFFETKKEAQNAVDEFNKLKNTPDDFSS